MRSWVSIYRFKKERWLHPKKLMSNWICDCQLIGETGPHGLSVSGSASQILACCHHLYCGSSLRLWIFHGKHLTPFPESIFFLIETLGLECHRGVKLVCGPKANDGIYDAPVDDIRWIFSFLTRELLCPPWLIKRWCVLSLLLAVKRSALSVAFCWVEECFQSTQSVRCVLTNCDRFLCLISEELKWLSRGESAWISSVLDIAISIFHCPLTFSSWYLSCFHLCLISPSSLTKVFLVQVNF